MRLQLYIIHILLSFLIAVSATSCIESNKSEPQQLVRLDQIINNNTQPTLVEMQTIERYAQIMGLYNDSTTHIEYDELCDIIENTYWYNFFSNDTDSILKNLNSIDNDLERLNHNISYHFPNLPKYNYYGIISPYRQRIIIDSCNIYVALNHYLGEDYPGYASMPEYERQLKHCNRIPIEITEAILSSEYPYIKKTDSTTLNELIYEGAVAYTLILLLPDMDIYKYLGWNIDQIKYVESNSSDIWQQIVSKNLLYSNDSSISRQLNDIAESSSIISSSTPPRIGRYIGYCIANDYINANPGMTCQQILSPDFYNDNSVLIKASPKF